MITIKVHILKKSKYYLGTATHAIVRDGKPRVLRSMGSQKVGHN